MIARDRAGCSKNPSIKSLKLRYLAPVNVKFRASGGAPQAGEAMKSGLVQTQVFLFILIGIQSQLWVAKAQGTAVVVVWLGVN